MSSLCIFFAGAFAGAGCTLLAMVLSFALAKGDNDEDVHR